MAFAVCFFACAGGFALGHRRSEPPAPAADSRVSWRDGSGWRCGVLKTVDIRGYAWVRPDGAIDYAFVPYAEIRDGCPKTE